MMHSSHIRIEQHLEQERDEAIRERDLAESTLVEIRGMTDRWTRVNSSQIIEALDRHDHNR